MQDVEERRPMHAQSESRPGAKRPITHVQDHPAGRRGPAEQPVHTGRRRQGGMVEAQGPEHGEPGRLQHDPRAYRPGRIEPLEQANAVPIPVQQQRRRQPRRAAPRHRNVKTPHGRRLGRRRRRDHPVGAPDPC